MNNLLESKPKVYKKAFSRKETYERESFYYLKVEDRTGRIIEELGGDDYVQSLFTNLQQSSIESMIYKDVDWNHYDTVVEVIRRGEMDVVAKVTITKRLIPVKLEEQFQKIRDFIRSL